MDPILGLRKHSILMPRMPTNRPPSQCLSTGKKHPQSEQLATKEPKGWHHAEPLDEEEDTIVTTEHKVEKDEQKAQHNTQEQEEAPSNPLQQQDPRTNSKEISGNKRTHGSKGSELDKESPITITENQLSIVTTTPNSGGRRKVEKKKGRKE